MNPVLAQWLPVIVMLLAIQAGLLYNNKRLDDFKDLLRADLGKSKAELQTEIAELRAEMERVKAELQAEALRSEQRILKAIAEMKAGLKADIQALDRRFQRLEAPLLRTS
jgi:hypothetical protein